MADPNNSEPLSIRAICFDVGDTLVFDRPTRKERVAKALEICELFVSPDAFEIAYEAVERRGIELYLQGRMPDEAESAFELIGVLLTSLTILDSTELRIKVLQTYANIACERYVIPGAESLLERLKSRGFKLAVISDWEPDLQELLGNLSIAKYFETFSISSLVGATKPSRKLFDDCLQKLEVQPTQCLHIGDYYELDVAGAQSAGMHSVLFDSQERYVNQNLSCPVVKTFGELTAYLDSVNLSQ